MSNIFPQRLWKLTPYKHLQILLLLSQTMEVHLLHHLPFPYYLRLCAYTKKSCRLDATLSNIHVVTVFTAIIEDILFVIFVSQKKKNCNISHSNYWRQLFLPLTFFFFFFFPLTCYLGQGVKAYIHRDKTYILYIGKRRKGIYIYIVLFERTNFSISCEENHVILSTNV